MAHGIVTRSPRSRPGRIRAVVGRVATVAMLLVAAGCGGSTAADTPERDALSARIHASYAAALKRISPDYVVITYPETVGKLSDPKRKEFNVVSRLLASLGTPNESRKRADVLDTVEIGYKRTQYAAYLPDEPLLAKYAHGTVLFLNLEVDPSLKTVRHPRLAELPDLSLMVWDDPLSISTRGGL